ncbi:MAG: aminoacyl-tRNA hydrolase [Candidatus Vogelbacteria bacterium]|nr:aminoacyl-tRNA hydrolase [Candidatus Vogelbacteria bacterium]
MSYIIAGLGNPGDEYVNTRHNTGRVVLDFIKNSSNADFSDWKEDSKNRALVVSGRLGDKKVILVEPNNFMNNSGLSFRNLVISKKAAEELVVIHDDLDLPIGKYRISFNRGPGGHNGVKSIIKAIKTEAFVRIRVGISPVTPSGKLKKPAGEKDVEKLILGEFKKPELELLKKNSKKISDALICMITEGRDKAMSLYN